MTAMGVVLEIEELLFDTLGTRVRALVGALSAEGCEADDEAVTDAHTGRTALMALQVLPAARALDAVAFDLVLRRADDAATSAFRSAPPSFDAAVRDALVTLGNEIPVGVVTRAAVADAEAWLEIAGLTPSVRCMRSLGDVATDDIPHIFTDAVRRLHRTAGIAIVPAPLVAPAAAAGLRTIASGRHDVFTDLVARAVQDHGSDTSIFSLFTQSS